MERKITYIILGLLFCSTITYAQFTSSRLSGSDYVTLGVLKGDKTIGLNLGYDRFIANSIIGNVSINYEEGNFQYSKFRVAILEIGASYSYKVVSRLYLEAGIRAFTGMEYENLEIETHTGFTGGLVMVPELEYLITGRFSISVYYDKYFNIWSSFSNTNECIGIKIAMKL